MMTNDKRLTAAHEEYRGIRAEQVARMSAQNVLVAPVIALLAFAATLSPDLKQFIPLIVFPLSLMYYAHRFWINHLGQYLREVIAPIVKEESTYDTSWEVYTERVMWERGARRFVMVYLETGLPLLLIMFSVGMLATAANVPPLLFWVDVVAIVLTALSLPAGVYVNKPHLTKSRELAQLTEDASINEHRAQAPGGAPE